MAHTVSVHCINKNGHLSQAYHGQNQKCAQNPALRALTLLIALQADIKIP